MAGNSPHLAKAIQSQEAEQTTNRKSPKKSPPKQIIEKLLKTKDKLNISKAARKNTTLPIGDKQY